MLIFFFFFFASALSGLHLYSEPKFVVIGNPVILEQSHAHNAQDLWDRGSTTTKNSCTTELYPRLGHALRQPLEDFHYCVGAA